MKILISYHTVTGNTEQVANSIAESLTGEEVTLSPAKNVDPASLASYDVIFLGSGVYTASCGRSIKNLIKNAVTLPSKFVFFFTHASEEPVGHAKCFYRVEKQIKAKNCDIVDTFDCFGDTHPKKEQLEEMTPEQKKSYLRIKGHPDAGDLEAAKKFAKNIIQNLK